jgi:nudix-type nucleoside diphosphatase (YffH/AdpP family)
MDDKAKIISIETLSENWGVLKKITFDFRRSDGTDQRLVREVYDRGDAAAVLLYDPARGTVVLTRQFRIPLHARGEDPMLIEVCAGLLDGDNPEACARKEAEEETGYRVTAIRHAFDAHMSPGSVNEKLSFFVASYDHNSRISDGGGLHHEGEDIEVLELPFERALAMIRSGAIADAKTIMLLHYAALEDLFGYQSRD